LVLRLSVVVPALLLGLPALLRVFATTFTLGLGRLFLLFLRPLPLPVFATLRILRIRNPTRARQRHRADCRRQCQTTKVTFFHDYLLMERAAGKVMSPP
jgi:hypothetical protein